MKERSEIRRERWTTLTRYIAQHVITWWTVSVGSLSVTTYHPYNDRTLTGPARAYYVLHPTLYTYFYFLLFLQNPLHCNVQYSNRELNIGLIHYYSKVAFKKNLQHFIHPKTFRTFPLLPTTVRQSWVPTVCRELVCTVKRFRNQCGFWRVCNVFVIAVLLIKFCDLLTKWTPSWESKRPWTTVL